MALGEETEHRIESGGVPTGNKKHRRGKFIRHEPRVFSMLESNGVAISVWYPAHSFAILKTKSQMTKELVEAFRVLDGVKIAYPTNTVVLQKGEM